jgi:hypothetical protein
MKTARHIEETKEISQIKETSEKKGVHENSLKNLKPYVKGQCGNPGGRPKNDLAKEIAQAIFSNDDEEIYKAFAKALRSGNAYAFDVLANRAFGKMKETIEVTGLETLAERLNGIKEQETDGDSRSGS